MSAKNKGRPLPALLPLEYCSLARAAKLLECEVEDLLHWAETQRIRVHIRYSDEASGVAFISELNVKAIDDSDENKTATSLLPGNLIEMGYSALEIGNNCHGMDFIVNSLWGLWEVKLSINNVTKRIKNGVLTFNHLRSTSGKNMSCLVTLDEDISIPVQDLLILREDIQRLHLSITTGQSLDPLTNGDEIKSNLSSEVSELLREKPKERMTSGISKAVTALTDLVLRQAGEDPNLINNPHKLHSLINELLLKHKANPDGGFDLGISDNAYRDILSKGKSSIATEKS